MEIGFDTWFKLRKIFFPKRALFNEASHAWTLYLSKIGPVIFALLRKFSDWITNLPMREKYQPSPEIPKSNQVRFGTQSLRYIGPKVENSSSYHVKSSENLSNFKTLIKSWNRTTSTSKMLNTKLYSFTFTIISF